MDLLNELQAQLELASIPLTATHDENQRLHRLLFEPGPGWAHFDVIAGGTRLVNLIVCTYVSGEWWLGEDEPIRPLADLLVSLAVNGARTSGDGNYAWVDSLLTGATQRYPAPWRWLGSRHEPAEVESYAGSVDRSAVEPWIESWRE